MVKTTDPVAPSTGDASLDAVPVRQPGSPHYGHTARAGGQLCPPAEQLHLHATGQVQTDRPTRRTASTTYQYDDLDRLIRLISPDPSDGTGPDGSDPNTDDPDSDTPFTTYQYDMVGNVVSTADAEGQSTEYEYDKLYRLVKQTRVDTVDTGDDEVTEFTYDLVGNRTSLGGYVWSYDGLNRVTSESIAPNKTRTFKYDEAGNLIEKIDRLGLKTTYDYDTLNRPGERNLVRHGVSRPHLHLSV